MSTEKMIAKNIQAGDFSSVLRLVKDTSRKNGPAPVDISFKLLKELYNFCYKSIKETTKSPSSTEVDYVYELARILCENISSTWKCKRLTFMQCLYYINNYLVKHNPLHARKVCEFFFLLKASSFDQTWEPNEMLVISNIVQDFITYVNDHRLEIISSSGENSLSSWLDFVFRLFELNDLTKLYKLFTVLDSIWVKVYHQCNDKLKECVVLCLTRLALWFKHLSTSDIKVEPTDKDISNFFHIVDRTTVLLGEVEVISILKVMEDCLGFFKILFPQCEEDVNIINSCLTFVGNIGKPCVDYFDVISSKIINRTSKKSLALPIVVNFVIKFRSSMLKVEFSSVVKSRIYDITELLLELMLCSQKDSDPPPKISKMIMDLMYSALSLIAAPVVEKDSLVRVFGCVKMLVKQFIKAIPDTDNEDNISVGVSGILNAVLAYKKSEQYYESMWLCRYVLLIFLKIQPNVLWENFYYKAYVETWLRNSVLAYAKCNVGVEAQVLFIVLAAYQPKYTISAMRAWATLKKSKTNIDMDATVLDVMNANGEEIGKQFPLCKLSDVNSELLLLGEVYAYSKLRDLRGDPVLVVYKTAAKTVKDHVALANILCCTVESFSIDTSDTAHFPKLEASLNNMIKHLQKLQENGKEGEHDPSVTLCTIGNLFYHKARLEIQQSRQKSEVEVAANEKWNAKNKIPVFQAGGKDDLDMTEVDLIGSSFKLNQKSDVLLSLTNALNHWMRAEQSLVPNLLLEPTLSFMKGAGYLSRMYHYKTLETTFWNLLYKMASKLDSIKYQVLAAAELLSSGRSVESSIIKEIESIMQNRKRVDRKSYVYHLYLVSHAKNLLYSGKVEESRQALEKIDVSAILPHFLVNVQLTVLRSLLDVEQPKDETPLLPIVKLFENLVYIIKYNDWETFNEACVVQCLKIQTSLLLGSVYSDLKCVRRARLYTKTELTLVQRLALPASVCEFMTLKCWIDLLTWNVTDSDLNAQEVESMLELGVLKTQGAFSSELATEMSQGSAIKCVPHFLNKKDCDCHQCVSANYPSLALNAITNRILILIGNGVRDEAQNVISVGLSVVEIVEQKKLSSNVLWSPFSSSVARFYYVVARSYVLWKKYKEGTHYANRAFEMLLSEPIKNCGLIACTRQLIVETKYNHNYDEPSHTLPVSQRFAVKPDEYSLTPEPQKYSETKPWESTVQNPKRAPTGYYSQRKSLFSKNLKFPGPDPDENENPNDLECVVLDGTPPECEVKTADRDVRTKKKVLIPTIIVSNMPAEPKFFKKRLDVGDAESKFDDKLHLKMAALDLKDGDVSTPVDKRTGKKAALVGSSRNTQTEKTRLPRKNLFNAGIVSSLTSTTPSIKVFYDPEGLEHSTNSTTKKNKTKDGGTVKRATRLAALSKVVSHETFGTPTASKTALTAKGKLTFDDGSDNELELVHCNRRNQASKKNGLGKKCIQEDVETDMPSKGHAKMSKPNPKPIVENDSDDQDSVIVVNSRKVLNRHKNGESVLPKQIVHDETTFVEDSPVESSDVHRVGFEIDTKSKLLPASNVKDAVEHEVGVAERRSGSSRRLMFDGTGTTGKSVANGKLKSKEKTSVEVSKSKTALKLSNLKDDSEDENEPIVSPYRKVLNKEGHERCTSRRLIDDETTIDQSLATPQSESRTKLGVETTSKHSDSWDYQDSIAAPYRKVLGGYGKTGPPKRLIHDETTLMDQSAGDSPELIESSIVQTTPPRTGRKCLVRQSQSKPTSSKTAKEPSVVLAKKSTSRPPRSAAERPT